MCFRGLALIHATTLVSELGDFTRFDSQGPLVSFVGLVPTEDSSGKRRRQGAVTKSGNSAARRALVEAAWQCRLLARVTPHLRRRQHDQPKVVTDIAWKAQQRLCTRYRSLIKGGERSVLAMTAVARELVGFVWAVANHVERAQSHHQTIATATGHAPRGEDRLGARFCSKSLDAAHPATKRIYVLKTSKTLQAKTAPKKTTR